MSPSCLGHGDGVLIGTTENDQSPFIYKRKPNSPIKVEYFCSSPSQSTSPSAHQLATSFDHTHPPQPVHTPKDGFPPLPRGSCRADRSARRGCSVGPTDGRRPQHVITEVDEAQRPCSKHYRRQWPLDCYRTRSILGNHLGLQRHYQYRQYPDCPTGRYGCVRRSGCYPRLQRLPQFCLRQPGHPQHPDWQGRPLFNGPRDWPTYGCCSSRS